MTDSRPPSSVPPSGSPDGTAPSHHAGTAGGYATGHLADLARDLDALRAELLAGERALGARIRAVDPSHALSARNLAHYAALRGADRTALQRRLADAGLASLAGTAGATLWGVETVLANALRLAGLPAPASAQGVDPGAGRALLARNTRALLDAPPERRRAEIMVTMPREAARDAGLVTAMVAAGLDCARINCAHDGPAAWAAIIANLRVAEAEVGRACRVFMDLGGPKVRTTGLPEGGVRLRPGDVVAVTARDRAPSVRGLAAVIGSTIPEVVEHATVGDAVWFDDGKIGGVVTDTRPGLMEVTITAAPPGGRVIRSGKGINVPDTDLGLPPLTSADEAALPFVARHADMVGLSFVQRPEDVLALRDRLAERGGESLATVLKIETRHAVERLPDLVLAAMRGPALGLMIARGDLAVEAGWEHLPEIQEGVLGLSDAAHAPVIWATQVLDSLARKGIPSRPEITDAALAERAECVMLNKGTNVVGAISLLDRILERAQRHQGKARTLLPAVPAWSPAA